MIAFLIELQNCLNSSQGEKKESLFLCIIIVIERYDFRFNLNPKSLEVSCMHLSRKRCREASFLHFLHGEESNFENTLMQITLTNLRRIHCLMKQGK